METLSVCPECGAEWREGKTCQDAFYQMLFWENEYPGHGEVHHLMVLCYHLQHPSVYSSEGLRAAIHLLDDFLTRGLSPQEVRIQRRASVNSHTRTWKIKGTPTSHGAYDTPIHWIITAPQVIVNGANIYCESVRAWAQSVHETLKTTDVFSSK